MDASDFKAERDRLKAVYGRLFDEVSEILFRHDPIGINFGSNTDEYEPEVETILPRLKEAHSASELRRIIYEEFARWFNGDDVGSEEDYEAMAQEVWAAYQRHLN